MIDTFLTVAIIIVVFGPPCFFLTMGIRHFIPLMRGMKVPWYANALGPLLFFQDKYFTEEARPHRVRFLVYETAFIAWCLVMVFVFGKM